MVQTPNQIQSNVANKCPQKSPKPKNSKPLAMNQQKQTLIMAGHLAHDELFMKTLEMPWKSFASLNKLLAIVLGLKAFGARTFWTRPPSLAHYVGIEYWSLRCCDVSNPLLNHLLARRNLWYLMAEDRRLRSNWYSW